MFARHFIDSLDFARNGRELHGTVPVAEMPRLQDMLATPDGEISYVIRGTQDRSGKPLLEVTMDGLCQLRCQRCLNSYAYPVKLVSRLLLTQKVDLDEFADDEAELDSILADDRLDVIALLEEELLLSLPFAPKHPLGACQAVTEGLHEPEKNPFAVLAELKKK